MSIKGGDFITKKTESTAVFVPEEWNEEEKMLKQMIHDFLDKELHVLESEPEASKDLPQIVEMLDKAAELGLCGIAIEEKYGGSDLSFNAGLLYMEAFAYGFSFATTIGTHVSIGSLPIVYYGNEQQKEKYLPKIATAEIKTAYALTEPSAGSDANSGKTKAVLSDDGTHYKISGQKMWISNAGFASLFIVFARIEDDKNITSFLVPSESSNGITLGDEENKLGIHSSSTRQVFFNETKVPINNMLGERQQGFKIAMNALNVGRVKLGVACLEAQRRVITEAVKYSNERIQFKSPISSFGAIKEKISQMSTSCYIGESACYRAAKDIENRTEFFLNEGMSHQESELKGVEDFAIECSLIKIGISEDIMNCTDEGIQIFGGMGFSAEAPMESAWRDARIGRIYEGTNEINRMLSFGELMKKGFQTKEIDIKEITKKIPLQVFLKAIGAQKKSKNQMIENFKYLFFILSKYATDAFGRALEHEQEIIMNLSDVLAEILVLESTFLRVEKLKNSEQANDDIKMKENIKELQFYESNSKIIQSAQIIFDSLPTKSFFLKYAIQLFSIKPKINPTSLRREIALYFINNNNYF